MGGQLGQQLALSGQQVGHGCVDGRHAGLGQLDDDATAVVGVGAAADESAALEPVDPVGHGAAGDKRLLHELSGGELVGLAGPAQGGEHVELPPLQAVLREGLRPVEVQAPGQPRDAREDVQRGDVEVGALAVPGLDDPVDVVGPRLGHGGNSTPHQVS